MGHLYFICVLSFIAGGGLVESLACRLFIVKKL